MTSQPGKQTIAVHILPNGSRSTDIQIIKICQLVEKLFPDPFLKNQNWAYVLINNLKFLQFIFVVCQVEGLSKCIEAKLFYKTKTVLELVSQPHFLHDFFKKCFSCFILLTNQISLPCCLYFVRCWALCVLPLFINQVMTS